MKGTKEFILNDANKMITMTTTITILILQLLIIINNKNIFEFHFDQIYVGLCGELNRCMSQLKARFQKTHKKFTNC